MFTKYLLQCLLSLLLFNHINAALIDSNTNRQNDPDNEIISSEDNLSIDDKFFELQDSVINKLEPLGRLEDLINKGNKEIADNKNNLDSIDNKLLLLEDYLKKTLGIIEKIPQSIEKINQRLNALENAPKIEDELKSLKEIGKTLPNIQTKLDTLVKWSFDTRSNTEQTLKAMRKIPVSLEKLNNRLEVLEESPKPDISQLTDNRVVRAASTSSNQDQRNLENMVNDIEKDFIANNKLYNDELFKIEMLEVDDLDKMLVEKSGCKYLSLNSQDVQVYQMDNNSSSLVTVAYNQLATYRHIRRADFESHMAIRSSDSVYILLWEGEVPDLSEQLNPDYEIGFGVDSYNGMTSSLKLRNGNIWRKATPNILSTDQYKKFYIKAYDGTLEFGTNCDEEPLHVHNLRRNGNIVAIGFLSKSTEGAKILLDCSASTCADPL